MPVGTSSLGKRTVLLGGLYLSVLRTVACLTCCKNARLRRRLSGCLLDCRKNLPSRDSRLSWSAFGSIGQVAARGQPSVAAVQGLLCNSGSLCDEKHMVFECSSLQGLRDEYAFLFSDMCTMKQFLWQDDLVSVAKFIHACLDKMFLVQLACPMTARHLISLMWLEEM